MWTIIGGAIQLIVLILSKWIETDAAKKKEKEKTQKELADAIKSGDTSTITAILSGL